jgi:hypothetical protein
LPFPLKSVKIQGHNYKIVSDFSEDCKKALQATPTEPHGSDGLINHATQTIYICPLLEIDQVLSTFIHELLHGISHLLYNDKLFSANEEEEEQKVYMLASALYEVLINNKFLRYNVREQRPKKRQRRTTKNRK